MSCFPGPPSYAWVQSTTPYEGEQVHIVDGEGSSENSLSDNSGEDVADLPEPVAAPLSLDAWVLPLAIEQEWQDTVEEQDGQHDDPNLPRYCPEDDQVRVGPPEDSKILGRLKLLREGTPAECLSVYCRQHRCSKLVPTRRCPAQMQILRWFQDGEHCNSKAAHMALRPTG